MARVGGRSAWIAWPIGVICAAVVAALVWLALPGVPAAVQFTGDMLRGATSAPLADGEGADATPQPATDCRSLYPDPLWAALAWTPDVLLSQNMKPPATTTALTTALAPAVRFTCTWRVPDGRSISTTLATVPDGSGAVAEAALDADGFACTGDPTAVHCERTRDGVTEIHDIRGTAWLSSVLTNWLPDGYAEQTASRAF